VERTEGKVGGTGGKNGGRKGERKRKRENVSERRGKDDLKHKYFWGVRKRDATNYRHNNHRQRD